MSEKLRGKGTSYDVTSARHVCCDDVRRVFADVAYEKMILEHVLAKQRQSANRSSLPYQKMTKIAEIFRV